MDTKKRRLSKKDYLLIFAGLGLGTVMLIVLITTRPDHPTAQYRVKVGGLILLMAIFALFLPGLSRLASVRTLPETLSLFVVGVIVGAFWLLIAGALARAVVHKNIGAALLLGLGLVGVTNVLRDLLTHIRKGGAKQRKRKKK